MKVKMLIAVLCFIATMAYLVSVAHNGLLKKAEAYDTALMQVDMAHWQRADLLLKFLDEAPETEALQSTFDSLAAYRGLALRRFDREVSGSPTNKQLADYGLDQDACTFQIDLYTRMARRDPQFDSTSSSADLLKQLESAKNRIGVLRHRLDVAAMEYNRVRQGTIHSFLVEIFGWNLDLSKPFFREVKEADVLSALEF